jgi:hypothetical protein
MRRMAGKQTPGSPLAAVLGRGALREPQHIIRRRPETRRKGRPKEGRQGRRRRGARDGEARSVQNHHQARRAEQAQIRDGD